MKDRLTRGMIYVFLASVATLASNVITSFILPKYLSIYDYAMVRKFVLYLTYAGFFHFGYADGMYIRYGGMDKSSISLRDFDVRLSSMRCFQLICSLIFLIISLLIHDYILLFFSFVLLPFNMVGYFKNYYQAVGEFKRFSYTNVYISIVSLVLNLSFVFILKLENYIFFICVYLVVYCSLWLLGEVSIRRDFSPLHTAYLSISVIKEEIKSGFLLMVGNFISIVLTTMDRWFVSFLVGIEGFALYSFAVSAENMMNVLVTPLAVTLYNFFCKCKEDRDIKEIKQLCILFSTFSVSLVFICDQIVMNWLDKYSGARTVMYCLFAGQIFMMISKGVFFNLYKAHKRQNDYFKILAATIVIGLVLNIILWKIFLIKEAFAVATALSEIILCFMCSLNLKKHMLSFIESVYILACTAALFICAYFAQGIIGLLIYLAINIILSVSLMNSAVRVIMSKVRSLNFTSGRE